MKSFESIVHVLKNESSYFEYFLNNQYIDFCFANEDIPEGSKFIEKNPNTEIEIWNKDGNMIIKSDYALVTRQEKRKTSIIFREDAESPDIYGTIRSELTNLLRNNLSEDVVASVHAACVKINNRIVLIIGDKGTGKSSSSIYLHSMGGEIYTDELVIFKNDGSLLCLPRLLGVDRMTLLKYFPDYKNKVKYEIKSMHNVENKLLLDIMKNSSEVSQIDDVFILIQGKTENISAKEKIALISKQWSTYDSGETSEVILKNIINKAKPMTLNLIREGIL